MWRPTFFLSLLLVVATIADFTPEESASALGTAQAAVQSAASIHAPLAPGEVQSASKDTIISSDVTPSELEAAAIVRETRPPINATRRFAKDKRAVQVVCTIADGCTNSGTTLVNGRLIYSSGGAIVEAPYLKSYDGRTLTMVDPSASGSSIISSVKLNLVGVDSSSASGPNVHFYTNADNYPLMQILPFSHNNIALSFDAYWDTTTWKPSISSSYFQIYKQNNQLEFRYGAGGTVGAAISNPLLALYIGTDGKTNFVQPIRLATPGGTATDLNYYSETINTSCPVTVSAGSYNDTTATVMATRVGNKVTVAISSVTGTLSGSAANIYIDGTCIGSTMRPASGQDWLIVVQSGGSTYSGFISWDSANLRFVIKSNSYSTLSVGTSGIQSSAAFSYLR